MNAAIAQLALRIPHSESRHPHFMKSLFALYIAVATWATAAALPFVHPGALNSKEELDYVKAKIQSGAQPWKAAFELLRNSNIATRSTHGQAHIDSTNQEAKLSEDDANAAYGQALLWYFTGEEAHAQRSIAILNAWAGLESNGVRAHS